MGEERAVLARGAEQAAGGGAGDRHEFAGIDLETAMKVATDCMDYADGEVFVFVRGLLPLVTRWVGALRVTTSG